MTWKARLYEKHMWLEYGNTTKKQNFFGEPNFTDKNDSVSIFLKLFLHPKFHIMSMPTFQSKTIKSYNYGSTWI